jgi:NADH dehydrogenase FAD-containing subunit
VVVVGGSDTALSLLEHLVFNPHLHFNNITLVSPHGLPQTTPIGHAHSRCYTEDSLSKLGLRAWVSVVRGRLIGLNREDQSITIEGGDCGDQLAVLHYDYLVLCTGLQYQVPPDLSQEEMTLPRHVFTVNDRHQEMQMMQWISKRLTNKQEGKHSKIVIP